jgi:hypothetical protein
VKQTINKTETSMRRRIKFSLREFLLFDENMPDKLALSNSSFRSASVFVTRRCRTVTFSARQRQYASLKSRKSEGVRGLKGRAARRVYSVHGSSDTCAAKHAPPCIDSRAALRGLLIATP